MPQVHNKSLLQAEVGVKFLSTMSLSGSSLKTVQIKNSVVRKLRDINMRLIEKLSLKSNWREIRMKERLKDSLKRMVAYKKVVEYRSLARTENYKNSLDLNYSELGMKSEIRQVLYDTDPETIRRRRSVAMVEQNRRRYKEILQKSKEDILKLKQRTSQCFGENTETKMKSGKGQFGTDNFQRRRDESRQNRRLLAAGEAREIKAREIEAREIKVVQSSTLCQPITAFDKLEHKHRSAREDIAHKRMTKAHMNKPSYDRKMKEIRGYDETSWNLGEDITKSRAEMNLPPLKMQKYISTGIISEASVLPKRVYKLPPVKVGAI